MKCIVFLFLLMLSFLALASPIDRARESNFKMLEQADPRYREYKAALCVKLLQSIKKDTFASAGLQQKIDVATLLQTSVNTADRDRLKKLKDLLLFENSEYAQNCTD